MAANRLDILVNMSVKGKEQVKGAADELKRIDGAAAPAGMSLRSLATGVGIATAALGAMVVAGKAAWGILKEGAAIDGARYRFDNLSSSIGTTGDRLLNDLRAATQGTVSDMELMAAATELVGLKLTTTHDQTVRMAAVAGQLGWNMQALIMEMNNMTGLRLDALGLSMEDVKAKAKELEEQGYSTKDAWAEAIIQMGEAKVAVAGMTEAEIATKKAEASVNNLKTAFTSLGLEMATSLGVLERIGEVADTINFSLIAWDALQAGEITTRQFASLMGTLDQFGAKIAAASMEALKLNEAQALAAAQAGFADAAFAHLGVSLNTVTGAEANFIMATYGVANAIEAVSDAALRSAQAADEALGLWAAVIERANAAAGVIGNIRSRQAMGSIGNIIKKAAGEAETATGSFGGFAASIDHVAEARGRMASAFDMEISTEAAEGLIGENGLVNVNAMNDALYDQAKAAGASAATLAMLGVATGKFTKEQAAAALKAAILQERIAQIAKNVASGNIKYDEAIGSLDAFRQQLDENASMAEGATGNVEDLASAAQEVESGGPYTAQVNAETAAAQAGVMELYAALRALEGVYTIVVREVEDETPAGNTPRASGGPVTRGRPYMVGEVGPELFVPNQAGYIVPNNALNAFQGGSTYTVNITNYVEGKVVDRTRLDDITTDSLMHALRSVAA